MAERSPIPEHAAKKIARVLEALIATQDQSQILLLHERAIGILHGTIDADSFSFSLYDWTFGPPQPDGNEAQAPPSPDLHVPDPPG